VKSEDQNPTYSEIASSNFQFLEQFLELVIKDIEPYSKPTDQIPSNNENDDKYLIQNRIFFIFMII
jgi:hypothetical protein